MDYPIANPNPNLYVPPGVDPHLYAAPAAAPPHHHPYPHPYHPYYTPPNPNPNPNPPPPGLDNPIPTPAPADPGIAHQAYPSSYHQDPYAAHGGYEAYQAAYAYPQAAVAANYYYAPPGGVEGQWAPHPVSYPVPKKSVKRQTKTTRVDLETKRRKLIEGGTAAGSVRVCEACNIVCNSDTVFATHLAGEKHAIKVLGKRSNGAIGVMGAVPTYAKLHMASNVPRMPTPKKAPKVVQSVICEVCKIECDTQDVLNSHKTGKKHKKNLQKLQESITAKPAPGGEKRKKATEENLEAKKQKILDAGAAADEVRVCTACNIVCNSQTVFDSHVGGQRHISMVTQQQQQQTAPVA